MGTAEIIAVVAAGGGLGYLIWKALQPAPVVDDKCTQLCKLVPDYEGAQTACIDACKIGQLLGPVISAISPFYDSSEQWEHEVYRRTNINNAANGGDASSGGVFGIGATKADTSGDSGATVAAPPGSIPMPKITPARAPFGSTHYGDGASTSELVGSVMRYPNGCEPYFDAPGFSKCGAGTLDMYASAVDASSSKNYGITEKDLVVRAPTYTYVPLSSSTRTTPINKNAYGTGGPGDPLTTGPFSDGDSQIDATTGKEINWKANGGLYWWVRGVKVKAPAGSKLVPRAVVMQNKRNAGDTDASVLVAISALTDPEAVELVDPAAGGSGVTVKVDCNAVQAKDSTFTWDPSSGGFWRRMKAGETRNLGPCAGVDTSSTSSTATKAGLIGGQIFGTSIGT